MFARIASVSIFLAGLSISGAAAQTTTNRADSTDDSLQERVTKIVSPLLEGEAPLDGIVVGVIHGNKKEVFGFKQNQEGNSPDGESLFRIASVTKPFTALLCAKLAVAGKLTLHNPVTPCPDSASTTLCFHGTPVTFFQLITHTSGLPLVPSNFGDNGVYTMADFERFLTGHALEEAPGSKFQYSTVGYGVLGMKLAEVCGQSFESCLSDEILESLRMSSTTFGSAEKSLAAAPSDNSDEKEPAAFLASGGLWSTAEDLLRLVEANIRPGLVPDLSEAITLTQKIHHDVATFQGSVAALGWHYLVPFNCYWHSGVSSSSRAFVAFNLQKKCGVVMLTGTGLAGNDTRVEFAGFNLLAGFRAQ